MYAHISESLQMGIGWVFGAVISSWLASVRFNNTREGRSGEDAVVTRIEASWSDKQQISISPTY